MSQLDPVQIAALDFARDKLGVGFFLEQGLGKSLVALQEFQRLSWDQGADRMIVVCPNSFKMGWHDEIKKHDFSFAFDVHIFQSAKKKEASKFISRSHYKLPIFIVNYEALRMPNVLKALCTWASRGKTYLAIDESIQIKGHRTAQTKAVHKLALECRYVRLLTGRPTTQGPHDLWGQLRAIGLFKDRNFYAFRGAFCVMGGWQAKEVVAAKNPEALAAAMAPVVFQAKKKDWLPELPRKDYTIRDYEMSAEQLKQYAQMEHQFLLEIENWRHHRRRRHRQIRQARPDPDRIHLRRPGHCARAGAAAREPAHQSPAADARGGGRRQGLRRLPAQSDPHYPRQGARRLESGLDQGRDDAGRDDRAEGVIQREPAPSRHFAAVRRL